MSPKYSLFLPHFIRISQREALKALVQRTQDDRSFALGYDHAPEADHLLASHRVADDGESILADLVVRHDVVGSVEVSLVDVRQRHELVDLDGVAAVYLKRL